MIGDKNVFPPEITVKPASGVPEARFLGRKNVLVLCVSLNERITLTLIFMLKYGI